MTTNQKCVCTGPVCNCGADGVLKDGCSVKVSIHQMDGALGDIVLDGITIDQATIDQYKASPEFAYDKSKFDMVERYRGDDARKFGDAEAMQMLADRIRTTQRLEANLKRMAS